MIIDSTVRTSTIVRSASPDFIRPTTLLGNIRLVKG